MASIKADVSLIEVLLAWGADKTVKDKKGRTPEEVTPRGWRHVAKKVFTRAHRVERQVMSKEPKGSAADSAEPIDTGGPDLPEESVKADLKGLYSFGHVVFCYKYGSKDSVNMPSQFEVKWRFRSIYDLIYSERGDLERLEQAFVRHLDSFVGVPVTSQDIWRWIHIPSNNVRSKSLASQHSFANLNGR